MGVRLVIIQLIDRDSAQMNPRFFLYSSILSDRLGAESRSNTFAAELPSDARTGWWATCGAGMDASRSIAISKSCAANRSPPFAAPSVERDFSFSFRAFSSSSLRLASSAAFRTSASRFFASSNALSCSEVSLSEPPCFFVTRDGAHLRLVNGSSAFNLFFFASCNVYRTEI